MTPDRIADGTAEMFRLVGSLPDQLAESARLPGLERAGHQPRSGSQHLADAPLGRRRGCHHQREQEQRDWETDSAHEPMVCQIRARLLASYQVVTSAKPPCWVPVLVTRPATRTGEYSHR